MYLQVLEMGTCVSRVVCGATQSAAQTVDLHGGANALAPELREGLRGERDVPVCLC